MPALIGLSGLFGFVFCLVIFIIAAIRKKPKKTWVIGMPVCFALFVVGLAITPPRPESPADKKEPIAAVTESSKSEPKDSETTSSETLKSSPDDAPSETSDPEVSDTVSPKPTDVPQSTIAPSKTPEPEPKVSEPVQPTGEEIAKAYVKWIENQFSPWDGSHIDLVKLVKENMNDPKSFEHVETRYSDEKDGILIIMKFRGNNAFGGKVLNYVTAKADYKTNTIKIIPNE